METYRQLNTQKNLPEVNGILIPEEVLRQLRMMLDIPLERMPPWAYREALNSFIDDGDVIDDENGTHLFDSFRLDWDEKSAETANENSYYADKLKREREECEEHYFASA